MGEGGRGQELTLTLAGASSLPSSSSPGDRHGWMAARMEHSVTHLSPFSPPVCKIFAFLQRTVSLLILKPATCEDITSLKPLGVESSLFLGSSMLFLVVLRIALVSGLYRKSPQYRSCHRSRVSMECFLDFQIQGTHFRILPPKPSALLGIL